MPIESMFKHRKPRNNGKAFERVVMACQGGIVALEALPPFGARFTGPRSAIRMPICCDFAGTVIGTGRGIYFDAKSDSTRTRFDVGDTTHAHAHQIKFLIRMGEAGALSGLLVEAVHPEVRGVYWYDWRHLLHRVPSVKWTGPELVDVGGAMSPIDFRRVLKA